jgi:hypothetical protein
MYFFCKYVSMRVVRINCKSILYVSFQWHMAEHFWIIYESFHLDETFYCQTKITEDTYKCLFPDDSFFPVMFYSWFLFCSHQLLDKRREKLYCNQVWCSAQQNVWLMLKKKKNILHFNIMLHYMSDSPK